MYSKSYKLLIYLLLLKVFPVFGQWQDSLQWQLLQETQLAIQSYQPQWMISNKDGIFHDQQKNLLLGTKLEYDAYHRDSLWKFSSKLRAYIRLYPAEIVLAEAHLKATFRKISFIGGRWVESTGKLPAELSIGSLGISRNALPVPRVGLMTSEPLILPFFQGQLGIEASWFHGWMDHDRSIRQVRLHQKSLSIHIAKNDRKVYGGLYHFVLWGGELSDGTGLPSSVSDYGRMIIGASSGETINNAAIPGELTNALGDHRIVFDFGLRFPVKAQFFQLYTQSLFEKGVGTGGSSRDKLAGLKIMGRDRLIGINWQTTFNLLNQLVIERLQTSWQGGDEFFVGRDNYYNNGLYRSGWTYQGQIMGNPLFFTQSRAIQYGIHEQTDGGWKVVNNRVNAWHLAVRGKIQPIDYTLKVTYTRNLGNYYNSSLFNQGLEQWYTMLELKYRSKKKLATALTIASDLGELSYNIGIQLGFSYQLWH